MTPLTLKAARNFVSQHVIHRVELTYHESDGDTANISLTPRAMGGVSVRFADKRVAARSISYWRSLFGAALYINGIPAGEVGRKNDALNTIEREGEWRPRP